MCAAKYGEPEPVEMGDVGMETMRTFSPQVQ
jgi:hypothetical protein